MEGRVEGMEEREGGAGKVSYQERKTYSCILVSHRTTEMITKKYIKDSEVIYGVRFLVYACMLLSLPIFLSLPPLFVLISLPF